MKAQRQIPTVREVRRVPLWPELKIDQPISEAYKIAFQVHNGVEFVDPLTVTHLEAQSKLHGDLLYTWKAHTDFQDIKVMHGCISWKLLTYSPIVSRKSSTHSNLSQT